MIYFHARIHRFLNDRGQLGVIKIQIMRRYGKSDNKRAGTAPLVGGLAESGRIRKAEEETDEWYKNFNIDFILRVGIVYNNSKYFAGTSFVGRTYDYYRNNFSLNNGFGTLQVYAGFNFCLKKEHRKKKQ
jgi:hypothetical protein